MAEPVHASGRRRLLAIAGFCILIQLLSRYAAAPVSDFSMDDWALLARAQDAASMRDVFAYGLRDPDRPVQAALLHATFRLLGDAPWRYALLSAGMYSIFLLLGVCLVWKLTASHRISLLFGIFFSLFPNLTESFHWAAMTTVAYMQVAYVASALCWVCFLERRRMPWLLLSLLTFAIGLGSYEFGIGLPLVYLILIPRKDWRALWPHIAAYFVVLALYLLWRFTHGFGMAHGILFAPRKFDPAAVPILWNALGVVRWWAGSSMFDAVRQGWDSFASLPAWHQRLLVVANVLVLFAAVRLARQEDDGPAGGFGVHRTVLFGIGWALAGHALNLVSWTAARLNFFPAVGVAIVLAILIGMSSARTWRTCLVLLGFAALLANQGTAKAWHDAGVFQRRIYDHVQNHLDELRTYDVVVFDTRALRQRLTPGLLEPVSRRIDTWAYYGNASLLRGFVPAAMFRLQTSGEPRGAPIPRAILDTECQPVFTSDAVRWHEPWNPGVSHSTPTGKVVVLDTFAIGCDATR